MISTPSNPSVEFRGEDRNQTDEFTCDCETNIPDFNSIDVRFGVRQAGVLSVTGIGSSLCRLSFPSSVLEKLFKRCEVEIFTFVRPPGASWSESRLETGVPAGRGRLSLAQSFLFRRMSWVRSPRKRGRVS